MEINDSLMDFWIDNDLNVHFEGRRGTGKTERVKAAFNRKFGEEKWLYFSAPTMDPWVDFVGVPKESKSPKGNECLTLIRPAKFADDEVHAIFFDELNRAKPKVIDAVMELIQFKSINGRKFPNLRVVWCATNPKKVEDDDTEEYSVEELDPAHKDRFQIFVEVDYKMDYAYFRAKYPLYADAAIAWWNSLEKNAPKLQNKISPRRMDYALFVFSRGGDIAYVLPKEANVSVLVAQLKSGSYEKKLKQLYVSTDENEIRKALLNENFFTGVRDMILHNSDYLKKFTPYFPNEKFNSLLTTDDKFKNFVLDDKLMAEACKDNVMNIIDANKLNSRLIKELKEKMMVHGLYQEAPFQTVVDNHYNTIAEYMGIQQSMMRIVSLMMQDKHISTLDEITLRKGLVVVCCCIANWSGSTWPSSEIAMEKIKQMGQKFGLSFREMMKDTIRDENYISFVGTNVKVIQKIISEKKLLSDVESNTILGTTEAAA